MRIMFLEKFRLHRKEWLREMFPIIKWFPKYRARDIPYDFIAGLTVALTLLPISLAYAQMASLRPEFGLYSSFLGEFIYLFMGTAKDAIIGPSAINSLIVGQFNALNPLASQGDITYSCILSFISGIVILLVGVLKLGFIVNLFSIPVVSGFTTAASLTIIASQFKSFFGLKSAPNDSPGMFVRQVKNVYDNWSSARPWDYYFGIGALSILLGLEYSQKIVAVCAKKCAQPKTANGKRMKAIFLEAYRMFVASRNIIVFVPAMGIAYYLVSQDKANEKKLSLVGYIKPGFPIPRFPRFSLINQTSNETIETAQEVVTKLSVAFIIQPLMLMMEMFAILKALARKNGYQLNPTNELIAIGLSNFLQSFIQAYPITAATAKSALNDQCRVKSLLSTLVSIVLIIVAIETMTGIFYYVPKAVLAAILIAAAHHLFDWETVIHIYKEYKPDLFMFAVTFLLCLFYDLAYGILIAILLNMVTFLRPVVKMDFCVTKEPLEIIGYYDTNSPAEHVTVIQLSHGMKYPSCDKFIDRMSRLMATNDHHFVIDCRFVTGIDFSGLQAWRVFLRMVYQKKKHVIFANLLDSVRHQLESIGLEHFRYVEDIEMAVNEHNTLKSNNLQDVQLVGEKVSTRLRHMISILSSGSLLPVNDAPPPANLSRGSFALNEMATHQKPPEEIEADKEQEARLMKILSYQPHYFHDIGISADGNGSDDTQSSPADEETGITFGKDSEAKTNVDNKRKDEGLFGPPPRYRLSKDLSSSNAHNTSSQRRKTINSLHTDNQKLFNRSLSQDVSRKNSALTKIPSPSANMATQTNEEDES